MSELKRYRVLWECESGIEYLKRGVEKPDGEWVIYSEAHALEVENEKLKARVAELEATQTRWVKCSERMPEHSELPGRRRHLLIDDRGKHWLGTGFGEWFVFGLKPGDAYPNIVAWLENVPEYVP